MAKRFRKLCALLLALVMCVCILPANVFAAQKTLAIDKVANGLDANDQTDVTLTVGGEESNLGVDIIYILGAFLSYDQVQSNTMINCLIDTFREIIAGGTTVNFGIAPFASTKNPVMPLTKLESEEDLVDLPAKIAAAIQEAGNVYDGVNMENGLMTAKEMFAASELASHPERQHLVMISSGQTYFFNTDDGNETIATVPVSFQISGTDSEEIFYYNKAWQRARNNHTNGYPLPKHIVEYYEANTDKYDSLWDCYWEIIEAWVKADRAAGDTVVFEATTRTAGNFKSWLQSGQYSSQSTKFTYSGYGPVMTEAMIGDNDIEDVLDFDMTTSAATGVQTAKAGPNPFTVEASGHAIGNERAMYEAYEYLTENITGAGINFYPIYESLNPKYDNGDGSYATWTDQHLGHSFMNFLAGGEAVKFSADKTFFDPIKSQIMSSVAAGSYVEDFIGCNENGNFEFIEEADCITLNVGGKDYITTMTSDTEEGSSYAFAASVDAEPTFWLDYTYGDGKTTEKFIWTFGENVSMANVAKLTYKLQLTEKQTVEGTYTVPTNNSATLYPKDSDGNDGEPQLFPVPEVEYTVTAPGGNIIVKKVDENGNPLTGAAFELFDSEGNSLGEYDVDENGKITFECLKPGTYKLVETVTPAGYIGVSEPIYFEVVRTVKGEFEAKDAYVLHFPATAYEISNHSFYPAIPQTFVMLDAEDAEGWEYSADADFQIVYCGDSETGGEGGVKYYRASLEEVYGENAGKIRAIVENSYPYVSLEDMIDAAVAAGVADAANLTRGDLIAAVQLAIWNYTNPDSTTYADGKLYQYRATYSVKGHPEWGYVYNDYEDELPDNLPKDTRNSLKDDASIARVEALLTYLINLPVTADRDDLEAFAYVAEGGKSASQTMIGCDGIDFYTEGNVVVVENTKVPSEEPPVPPTITFKNGDASNISFMLIDKVTGEVEFLYKVDIGSETSFEIPTEEGKISAVFVKQSTSGMFWASEDLDEKTQNAVIKCLKANNPSYKGHWDEFFFGEGDCTWEFKKNKSVTYTFSNVGATVESATSVVTPEVEEPVVTPEVEEPVVAPKAEIVVKGAKETARKNINGVTAIYIAANGKIPAVIWTEADTGLSEAELIAEFGAGSDTQVISGLGEYTIEYQQNKNKTKTVTYIFEVK